MKKLLVGAIIATSLLANLFLVVNQAQAFDINNPSGQQNVCSGSSGANSAYCSETANGGSNMVSGSGGIILTVVNLISLAAGVAAVILIIIGAFRFIISGGDSNQVSGARNMIIFSLIGILVIAFAQVIVRFTVGKL